MSLWVNVLENLSVLAAAAMLLFFVGVRWAPGEMTFGAKLAAGLLFGAAAALVILTPIEGPLGANVDTRAGPILIASYFYGPVAGGVSALAAAIVRYAVGGPFNLTGALSPFLYCLAGLAFQHLWRGRTPGPVGFAALGLLGTAFAGPGLFVGVGFDTAIALVTNFGPVLLVANVMGAVILGLLVQRFRTVMFQRRQTEAVLAHVGDAILTLDEGDRVIDANPAALRILDRPTPEVVGRPASELLFFDAPEAETRFGSVHELAAALPAFHEPGAAVVATRRDGGRRRLSYRRTPFTIDGRRRSIIVLRDLTEVLEARAEVQRMMGELVAQLQATAKANQSKSLFLANMSHELRTPLNAILGFSDLIGSLGLDCIPRAKLEEYLADINFSARVLLRLVDTVMDINRIERGDAVLSLETVDAGRLAANFVRIQTIERKPGERLRLIGGAGPFPVRCDPTAFIQCLANLVGNAFKHAEGGVEVRLSLAEREGSVFITVEDDGPGVPADVLRRLGEPFLRGAPALRRSVPGAGLGLAITKRLIEEQGGHLLITAREGGGTRAELTLPRAELAPAATQGSPLDPPPPAPAC